MSCFGNLGRRKKDNDDLEAETKKKPSKSQLKKAKAQNRKMKKLARKNNDCNKKSIDADLEEEENKSLAQQQEPDQINNENKKEKETVNDQQENVGEEKKLLKELEENEKNKAEPNNQALQATVISNKFEALQAKNKSPALQKRILDGSEEDDEDDSGDAEEGDWDWEWDTKEETTNTQNDEANVSDYIEVNEPKVEELQPPRVSLNPLPPERLIVRSSEDREKSSEPGREEDEEDSETGSHGDIEDNLEDSKQTLGCSGISIQDSSGVLRHVKPFKPDPERLDPHMEALCRKVRKLSVSQADPNVANDSLDGISASKEYEVSDKAEESTNRVRHLNRLEFVDA